MMPRPNSLVFMVLSLAWSTFAAWSAPLLHEIMYHPEDPEDPREEFIELYNPGPETVSLLGWRLRGGVNYTFPDVSMAADSYVVVVADTEVFAAIHPDIEAIGPWEGRLSNSGETLRLVDATGEEIDEVPYADDGDWAERVRGPDDLGHRGWLWQAPHDGEGASLELVQPSLSNRRGGNWAASTMLGGTPGAANSRHETDSAPLIFNVRQTPIIPGPDEAVTVRAAIRDEGVITATLVYHTENDPVDREVPMVANAEGTFAGTIPAQADEDIVSFHIVVSDGLRERLYPLPEAPCLYQVEAAPPVWTPGDRPLYRLIMSKAEAAELATIGSLGSSESNAQMNATFISEDGTGRRLRYLVGVRNRGASSRNGPPNNALVVFRKDDAWQGLDSLKFNVRNPASQAVGGVLFQLAGIRAADALPVRLWTNGSMLASGGYVQVESFDRHFAANQFPMDPEGNLYQVRDDEEADQEGDLAYRGEDPDLYRNTYFKQTNASEDDWTDLIDFTRRLNESELSDDAYLEQLEEVMDIDQWLRMIAVDTLLGNREGGLTTGKGDDFALYRGVNDPRFLLVPHDMDTLLGQGRTPTLDRSIWTYDRLDGFATFFDHPDVQQRYLLAFMDLLESFYTSETFDPLLDQMLGGWAPDNTIAAMKDFVAGRREGVLPQIPQGFTAIPNDAEVLPDGWRALSERLEIQGTYPSALVGSILVNGVLAEDLDPRDGQWTMNGILLEDGINHLLVEAYSARDGRGDLVERETIRIAFDDPETEPERVQDILLASGSSVERAELRLIVRDTYLPGVPILVRAELLGKTGALRRDLWEESIILRTDRADVQIEPAAISMTNGVGSALITITGPEEDGDFSLTGASLGFTLATSGLSETVELEVLEDTITTVSGTLPGAETTWSGVVHVTGNVTVPEDHTLTVEAGTLVLLDGNPTPLSTDGTSIDVFGRLLSIGTADQPITFTARDPEAPWGELHHHGGTSAYRYTTVTRGGHAGRDGHTNTGPAFHVDNTLLTLSHVAVTDIAGKIMQADGSDLVLERSFFARAAMGPEIAMSAVDLRGTTIVEMRGRYREDGITDDNDGIYLHRAGNGEEMVVTDLVIAGTDDDGFDTISAEVTVSDSIFRDCADKGVSLNGGRSEFTRCLMVGNTYGIQAKSDGVALTLTQSTMADNTTSLLLPDPTDDVFITNSIFDANGPEIEGEGAEIRFSLSPNALPGATNLLGDPRFVSRAAKDFRLLPDSPALNAGDPDGTTSDIGHTPVLETDPMIGGTLVWEASQSPFLVEDDVTVPVGVTLVIEPGVTVYVAPGKAIIVNGELRAEGTPHQRIQFTTDPDLPFVDDIRPGLPQTLPHWNGIRFVDSLSPNNRIAYADIGYAQSNDGAVGVFRSEAVISHCTFRATHLRMVYAESSSVIVEHCTFPDMFAPDERADALGLDNISEHIKGIGRYPAGGHFIIRNNVFGTNKGHNDVIDVDSSVRPNPILQVLDNRFRGAGDELLDLGGDVYVAGNVFFNVFKDDETSDRGYANAISTGDAVSRATIMATRNLFWDVDHAINLKRNVSTIFEYNTVHQVHGDFDDRFGNPNVGSVINLYVDEAFATPGDGAYMNANILTDIPRVFGNADLPDDKVSRLGFIRNWVDETLADTGIADRAETVFDLGSENQLGNLPYRDPLEGDFNLATYSQVRGAGAFQEDLGMTVRPGIHIAGEPAARTPATTATLTFGGPGMVAYRYRLNDGPWSDPLPIGDDFAGAETERTASLTLPDLVLGETYQVAAIGQDFAGNWQAEDEATLSKSWRIDPAGMALLNEVVASADVEYVELFNPNAETLDLAGWTLSDRDEPGSGYTFPEGSVLSDYGSYNTGLLGFGLDAEGDALYLRDPSGELVDRLTFGFQVRDQALGRVGDAWRLMPLSPGRANEPSYHLADPSNVRMSEWLGAGQVLIAEDFVELSNPNNFPVDLSGWTLHDGAGDPVLFPSHSYIGANGFVAIKGLGIDRLRDTLYLTDTEGSRIDTVLTDPQITDRSQTGPGVYAAMPTPGVSGDLPAEMEESLLDVLAGLRISEIMFHPAGNRDAEFIELQNVSADPIDLTGVRFTEGVRFTFPAVILNPGEQIILTADTLAFEQRYGHPAFFAYEGQLDNSGETLTLSLPEPYEVAILRFTFHDDWVPTSDGEGYSLVASAITNSAADWQEGSFWQASEVIGGTPLGFTQTTTGYQIWQASNGASGPGNDDDGDGLTNLEEYAYDSNPWIANARALTLTEEGLSVGIVERDELKATLESSSNLEDWEFESALTLPLESVPIARDAERNPRFIRLRFELQ